MKTRFPLFSPDPSPGGGGTPPPAPGTPPAPPVGAGTPPPAAPPSPPPPPPKPFYDGLYGADGKLDKAAFDRLPDHLKAHKDLFTKYETVDAMLNGFANAHSMAVKKAMAPLPENAPPEVAAERKAHLDTINNVPKDPAGYGIAKPEDLPEEFWDGEAAGKFGALAQKHSISPAAVKELLALQLESTKGSLAKGQAAETEFFAAQDRLFADAIKKDGTAPDRAADLATRGAMTLGIDPKSPIFKNAAVRLACLRAAKLVSEEKLVTGSVNGLGSGKTPREEARDIMSNPQNPMHKAWSSSEHPDHETAKDRVNELYRVHKGEGAT